MIDVSRELLAAFDSRLVGEEVPERLHRFYREWLRFYLDFCRKCGHDPSNRKSLPPFLEKLAEKRQPGNLRNQAAHAISIYYDGCSSDLSSASLPVPQGEDRPRYKDAEPPARDVGPAATATKESPNKEQAPVQIEKSDPVGSDWGPAYAALKSEIAIRHYSPKTLRAYSSWVRQLQAFTKSKETGWWSSSCTGAGCVCSRGSSSRSRGKGLSPVPST